MTFSRPARRALPAAVFAALIFSVVWTADAQQKKDSPRKASARKDGPAVDPQQLLAPKPRPKRPDLPPSTLPLEFIKNERIALVGNSTAERMNLFGHFEAMLHSRFPDKELIVRNFARPADEVSIRQRPNDYTKLDDPLAAFGPDTFLCFFGFNESFAGPDGVETFKVDYERFLDEYMNKYPRDDAGSKPRFVLISPIPYEETGNPLLPDGKAINENLILYAKAVKDVAAKRNLAFVDVYTRLDSLFRQKPGAHYTINGAHLNEQGDRALAVVLDQALFGPPAKDVLGTSEFEKLREAVNDKSWIHLQDYRMVNGWYVYGGRRTWDTETFPREYVKIRNMAAVRDRYIWDLANGKPVPEQPDDSDTGELITPPTRFGVPQQKYSEDPIAPRILPPDEFIKTCTVPPGFEIQLFADEKQFPEIANPVQLGFDNKGRLWVSTMPSYPQWRPGDPKPSDKLVILEDTSGDGRADKCTVFYDKLHCPTGFAFFNGGVLVVDQPRLIFLKDTDGDDKADVVVHLLDGWATDDTHHTVGAFEQSHGGLLHMLEGVAMSTTVETPWGPFRNMASPGAYVLEPKTLRIRHFVTPGYGNPWCYVFDEWNQGIVGDGTGAQQHWDTPLSGAQFGGRQGLNPIFNTEGMRPVVGSDFLVTRQFPDDVQRQFIYACVINMNGIPRWTITDDGAGFRGQRVKHADGQPFDLLKSTDKHFRPVDPQIGPDGALWFGDWANPLIGHMQYSQRDPNRDHQHGRIYRLVYKNKPLLTPVTQFGKPAAEVMEQVREYEWRTRERARRELHNRPAHEVLPIVAAWASRLNPNEPEYDRLLCEALWVQQGHHAVDPSLLKKALSAKTPNARAAAVRILADERERLPHALETFKAMALDDNLRVRTEAVRALSFYPTADAVEAVLAAVKGTNDYWLSYTAQHALGANEPVWRTSYLTGKLAAGNPEGQTLLDRIIAGNRAGAAAVPHLKVLLGTTDASNARRAEAMSELAKMPGNARNGREVFRRTCIACHKLGEEGQDYGPSMDKVATRLSRYKLVESIIDPNAEVDPKYLTTQIQTLDGMSISGLLVKETKEALTIFDGKETKVILVDDIEDRKTIKQSSMPEGLAGGLAPVEFLDLIEFLASMK
jgi:putative heme-binding domain-containing protein